MSAVYTNGVAAIMNGSVDLLTATVKAMLVTSGYTFDDTDSVVNDVTPGSNELSGAGYSRLTLGSKAVSPDTGAGRTYFQAGNLSWTGINAGTADAVILEVDTGDDATSTLVCYIDDGGFPVLTNGGNLSVTWAAAGIFYL